MLSPSWEYIPSSTLLLSFFINLFLWRKANCIIKVDFRIKRHCPFHLIHRASSHTIPISWSKSESIRRLVWLLYHSARIIAWFPIVQENPTCSGTIKHGLTWNCNGAYRRSRWPTIYIIIHCICLFTNWRNMADALTSIICRNN